MKKIILMIFGVTILTTSITAQEVNETKKSNLKEAGKFNSKKNIYQFSVGGIAGGVVMAKNYIAPGLSTSYYRSFNNKYLIGSSLSYFGITTTEKYQNISSSISTVEYKQTDITIVMVETKMRMRNAPQNRRVSGFVGLSAGYIFNYSTNANIGYNELSGEYISSDNRPREFTQNMNSFVLKGSLDFRINTSKNTGFIFENSLSFYNHKTKKETLSLNYDTVNGYYRICDYETELLGLEGFLTVKVGYFF